MKSRYIVQVLQNDNGFFPVVTSQACGAQRNFVKDVFSTRDEALCYGCYIVEDVLEGEPIV
jgi:hypothetical protein